MPPSSFEPSSPTSDDRLPSAQDTWDTLDAVLHVVLGAREDYPALALPDVAHEVLPPSVYDRWNNATAALPSQPDTWAALLAVLNAVGYPESFAEQHPTLTVSQGVARFLRGQALLVEMQTQGFSALDHWHTLLAGDRVDGIEAWLDVEPMAASRAFIGGKTPLMIAADRGAVKSLKALLPFSDPRATDDVGFNALLFAARSIAKPSILHALIPVSDLTVHDANGRTLVHHLVERGQVKPLIALLERIPKDRIDVYDKDGRSPLTDAVGESLEMVELLLPFCDPNVPDNKGWTPLMLAALIGKPDIVERLAPVSTIVHAPLGQDLIAVLKASPHGDKVIDTLQVEVRRHEQRVLDQVANDATDRIDPPSTPRPRL